MGQVRTAYSSTLSALVFSLSFTLAGSSSAFDLSACGQTVPRGEIGVLQVDLVCPPDPGSVGVMLERDAELNLNGHSITGGSLGVGCMGKARSCTIRGPGEISGSADAGVVAHSDVRQVIVEDVTISDNQGAAVLHLGSRRVSVKGVVIARNNLRLLSIPESRQRAGAIHGGRWLEVDDVTGIDNVAQVLTGRNIGGGNVTLTGNYGGLAAHNVDLTNLTVSDSIGVGIQLTGRRTRLENSTLANNDVAGSGVDILSTREPKLLNTSCSRSQVCFQSDGQPFCNPNLATWQVCADDF